MFNISKKLMKQLDLVCTNGDGIKVKNECFVKGCFGDPPGCYGCQNECVSSCQNTCRDACRGGCLRTCEGQVR